MLAGALPPPFGPGALLSEWRLDPVAIALAAGAGLLYAIGVRRVSRAGSPWAPGRRAAFFAGLGVALLSLVSPIDAYAEVLLSVHVLQHVLLALVSAPLLLLGAPVSLALRASSPEARRRFLLPVLHGRTASILGRPAVAWALFVGVQFGVHLSPLYEQALESDLVHALEHALFLAAGLVFWWPVVGRDPVPHRMGYPARLLYLALAMPVEAVLGVVILSASEPLYSHYASLPAPWGPSALSEQGNAGAIMWILGTLGLVVAALLVAGAWMRDETARQRRLEARLDRAGEPPL
jgi:cytochrome c oxidase assembly factor CtaG